MYGGSRQATAAHRDITTGNYSLQGNQEFQAESAHPPRSQNNRRIKEKLENLRKMFAEEDMNDQVRNIQNDWDRQHAGYDMGGAPRGPMNNEMHGG